MAMLALLVIIVLVLYVIYKQIGIGPTDKTNSKSYHLKTDKISEIIDRIEWSLLREDRVNYVVRYLMWGLWVTFLGSFLFIGGLPIAGIFLRNWIIVSIILLSLHGYYYWHSDKFSSFTSLKALEALRERIGVKKGDLNKLSSNDKKLTGADAPWTFTHTDYALGTKFPYDN